MAGYLKSYVRGTSTTTGTGTYTVASVSGFIGIAAAWADGDVVPLYVTSASEPTEYEFGRYTVGGTGTTLARTEIVESSNGGAAVDWGAGAKDIRCNLLAEDIDAIVDADAATGVPIISGRKPLTVTYKEEGSGNGLDADTVDGLEASAFARNFGSAPGFRTGADASKPSSGLTTGEIYFATDTWLVYIATSATTYAELTFPIRNRSGLPEMMNTTFAGMVADTTAQNGTIAWLNDTLTGYQRKAGSWQQLIGTIADVGGASGGGGTNFDGWALLPNSLILQWGFLNAASALTYGDITNVPGTDNQTFTLSTTFSNYRFAAWPILLGDNSGSGFDVNTTGGTCGAAYFASTSSVRCHYWKNGGATLSVCPGYIAIGA